MKKIDLNSLAQCLDTSWGRSSTPQTATMSVKYTMAGDTIVASYMAVVQLVTERQLIELKRRYKEESDAVIEASLKNVQKNYKEMTGQTIKFTQLAVDDGLEILSMNSNNSRRSALYRRKSVFEVK